MTQMYYHTPAGEPTPRIATLLPQIISPQYLSDAELADHGIARCSVVYPTVEWWQQLGAKQVDASATPNVITWGVESRPLEDVRDIAWQRVKAERDRRQAGLMPYTYPSGETNHNEMTEKVIRDLSASTTAALALASQGVTAAVMPWTTFENVTHWLTPAQMITFGLSATQWHSTIHVQSQTIRAAISAAEDVQGVIDAAVWPET